MRISDRRRGAALEKELRLVIKQERKLEQRMMKAEVPGWRVQAENRIPEKVQVALENAFAKAFSLVMEKGKGLLEKSYDKAELLEEYSIRDYAVQVKGGRRELRNMRKSAKQAELRNLALTTAEGVGLGALGIGIPDIVLFIGTLLKGLYETALHYGYDYDSDYERMLLLTMMAAALRVGEDRVEGNREVEKWLREERPVSKEELQEQGRRTAAVFAGDLLVLKFVQGLPLVGVIGGAANPIYYRKILHYAELKYRKRYLLQLRETMN